MSLSRLSLITFNIKWEELKAPTTIEPKSTRMATRHEAIPEGYCECSPRALDEIIRNLEHQLFFPRNHHRDQNHEFRDYDHRPPEIGGIDGLRGFKLNIPSFQGGLNPTDYLDWKRKLH
ncbi:unnamed protein product [Linum trigynum]|uniref:Uncharacterized protein n=1 Tax=Linum trigynum TaxID=586398 RepID=A0AAV2D721_9ROSI